MTGAGQTGNSAIGCLFNVSGGISISNISALNLTISYYGDSGFAIKATSLDTVTSPVVMGCSVANCAGTASPVTGNINPSAFEITGNQDQLLSVSVYNVIMGLLFSGNSAVNCPGGPRGGFGLALYASNNSLVTKNFISHVGAAGYLPTGIILVSNIGTTVSYNEVCFVGPPGAPGGDCEGIDSDLGDMNALIEYNYVHDCQGAGIYNYGATGTVVRFNVTQNNGLNSNIVGEINCTGDAHIYNNTFYSPTGSAFAGIRKFRNPRQ